MTQTEPKQLIVRPARGDDAAELCELLNEIITIGGSTAFEAPLTTEQFSSKFLTGDDIVSCFVAVGSHDTLLGFQWLQHRKAPPKDWGEIATFAKANTAVRGIGTALYSMTRQDALAANLVAINATIRADNVSGLGFYSKMGFEDYNVIKGIPLNDGTLLDRIQKKYTLV